MKGNKVKILIVLNNVHSVFSGSSWEVQEAVSAV